MQRSKSAGWFHSGRRNGNHPSPSYQKCLFGAHRRLFIIILCYCITEPLLSITSEHSNPSNWLGRMFPLLLFFTACWSMSNTKVGAQESALQINGTAIFEKHWQCVKMPQSDILMPLKKTNPTLKKKKDKSNIYDGIVWAVGLTCLLLGKIRQRVAIYRKSRCITPHRLSSTEHSLALFSTLYSHSLLITADFSIFKIYNIHFVNVQNNTSDEHWKANQPFLSPGSYLGSAKCM